MLRFAPSELTDAELALQAEVREFLAAELPRGSFAPGLGMAAGRDESFSRALAARGWLGMALPRRYGGAERGAVDRFIVVEELLRWGAPVRYHWVADRQTGPLILRYGTAAQRERFLPAICRGEVSFSIGMSEPEAGSDLAAVQTRATRTDGGLARERDEAVDRRRARERLVRGAVPHERRGRSPSRADAADRRSARTRRRPCDRSRIWTAASSSTRSSSMRCSSRDDLVVGEVGAGWAQNTSELAYERAGPERWLSTYLVVEQYLREHGAADERARGRAGRGGRRLVGNPRAVAVGRAPARRRPGARGGGGARQGAGHAL